MRIKYLLVLIGLWYFNYGAYSQCERAWQFHIHGLNGGNSAALRWKLSGNSNSDRLLVGTNVFSMNGISFSGINDTFLQASGGNGGIFFGQIDTNGQSIWVNSVNSAATFNIVAEDFLVMYDGSSYVCGQHNHSLIMEDTTITSPQGSTYFLMKFNANGEIEWVKQKENAFWSGAGRICQSSETDVILGVVFTEVFEINGQVFNVDTTSSPFYRDMILLKLNSGGETVWSKHIRGSGSLFIEELECFGDNCVVQGRFNETIIYDADTLFSNSIDDFRWFQFGFNNFDASLAWKGRASTSGVNGNNISAYNSLKLNDDDFITVGSYNTSTFTYKGQSIQNAGISDAFILSQKINSGEVNWMKSFGGGDQDYINDLAKTNSGVALGGSFFSTEVVYDGTTLINTNPGFSDQFILQIDEDGKPICVKDGIGNYGFSAIGSIVYKDNYLYCLSSFDDDVNLDGMVISAEGIKDLAIWKTCLPCDTINSIQESLTPTIKLYPNPATNEVIIETQSENNTYALFDVSGRQVMSGTVNASKFTLSIGNLSKGVYFLQVASGDKTVYGKLVKE